MGKDALETILHDVPWLVRAHAPPVLLIKLKTNKHLLLVRLLNLVRFIPLAYLV